MARAFDFLRQININEYSSPLLLYQSNFNWLITFRSWWKVFFFFALIALSLTFSFFWGHNKIQSLMMINRFSLPNSQPTHVIIVNAWNSWQWASNNIPWHWLAENLMQSISWNSNIPACPKIHQVEISWIGLFMNITFFTLYEAQPKVTTDTEKTAH